MPDGGDLRWLRETANLTIREAAKLLHVTSFELWLFEGHGRRVSDDLLERVRGIYREHAKPEKPDKQEPAYVPGEEASWFG